MTDDTLEAQARELARKIIEAWRAEYFIWCGNADQGDSYLLKHVARALAESRAGALREATETRRERDSYVTTLEKLKYRLEHFPIGPDSGRALLVVIDAVLGPLAAEAEPGAPRCRPENHPDDCEPGAQDRAGEGEK